MDRETPVSTAFGAAIVGRPSRSTRSDHMARTYFKTSGRRPPNCSTRKELCPAHVLGELSVRDAKARSVCVCVFCVHKLAIRLSPMLLLKEHPYIIFRSFPFIQFQL